MENFNFLAIAVAALVPLAIGSVWYSKIGFEKAWMASSGMTAEKIQQGNMAVTFGLTLVLGFIMAFVLQFHVIHQFQVFGLVANDPAVLDGSMNSEAGKWFTDAMAQYGDNFRTFGHGAAHAGIFVGLLLVTPIITVNALFEQRSFKYIAIHAGYWIVTLAIMGGIIGAWQ